MTDRRSLILDVDTGIDDAAAIAFALGSPDADVIAVTTLAGNVGVERTTANSLAVLDWLGAADVPVHRGASRPLARPHHDATYFHETDGLGGADLPPSNRAIGLDRGPAAMIRILSKRPGEVILVCLGPLTNLAIALNVEPRLPEWVSELVVMGGTFAEAGNVTSHAEFNVYCDPDAASQVFATPFPRLTVVGLDVSHRTAMSRAHWASATNTNQRSPAAELVHTVYRRTFDEREEMKSYLHDPLAVGVALDPSLIEVDEVEIAVDLDGEFRGRTRIVGSGQVRVARSVDADRFLDRFLGVVGLSAESLPRRP